MFNQKRWNNLYETENLYFTLVSHPDCFMTVNFVLIKDTTVY